MTKTIPTLAALMLLSAGAARADDRAPGPIWDQGTKPADPAISYTRFAIQQDAVRPRFRWPDESPGEAKGLDEAWWAGIDTYASRVHHMIAGMMSDRGSADMAHHCEQMGLRLHARFRHYEGREETNPDGSGGWAIRTKPEVMAACYRGAFQMHGFLAFHIRSEVIRSDQVQVTTCYMHNQWNDPTVKGKYPLANGTWATTRVSVETIVRQGGAWQIIQHRAFDVSPTMVLRGCGSGA